MHADRMCPCQQSTDEARQDGHCAGMLYWRSYADACAVYRDYLHEWQKTKRKSRDDTEEKEVETIDEELVAALAGLGYTLKQARGIAKGIPGDLSLEEKVKRALKNKEA